MKPISVWLLFCGLSLLSSCGISAKLGNDRFFKKLAKSGSDSFKKVFETPEYKLQIAFTSVSRHGKYHLPACRTFYFGTQKNQYLYPASLVKLPLSLVALEKLNRLKTENNCKIGRTTPIVFDSAYLCQQKLGLGPDTPSLDNFIKKMMLVSDNESYNRTYEFAGYDNIGNTLKSKGYGGMRIVHRFIPQCDSLTHLVTNPFAFVTGNDTVCRNPLLKGKNRYSNPRGRVFMGRGYMNGTDLVNEPKEFTYRNNIPLEEIHRLMQGLFIPATQSAGNGWNIDEQDLNALKKYMGMWPSESGIPDYPLPKNFKKYLLLGSDTTMPAESDIRIFNVVGRAYGVLADCAYVVDLKSGTEFFLSAVMYCNKRDVLNTDDYQYHNVGLPFMTELGRLIFESEKKQGRGHKHQEQVYKLKSLFN